MKKGMTRRRLLALVLCLAMLFSCVPQGAIPVFAAGDDTASQGQPDTGETPTDPEVTTEPTEPENTTAPTEPEVTTVPTEPEDTTAPTEPEVTTEPAQPEDTTAPTEPEVTTEPTEPQTPAEPARPQSPAAPLAGDVVEKGRVRDNSGKYYPIYYTITEEYDLDGTPYHVLSFEGTGAMPDYPSYSPGGIWYNYRNTLRKVTFKSGITSVGNYSFYSGYGGYPNLGILELPDTLISIGESAFDSCTGLTDLDLSKCQNLMRIGSDAFSDCTNLTSVRLPASLIELDGFDGCVSLVDLDLRACTNLKTIGGFRDCGGLTVLDFSACVNLTTVKSAAFLNCDGLTALNFSTCPNLTTIGSSAFSGCGSLTTLNLEDCALLISIGDQAFNGCNSLTTLSLKNCSALTTIGTETFISCSSLTSVDFSGCKALSTIGDRAFYRCKNITDIVMKDSNMLTQVSDSAFEDTNINSLLLAIPDLASADGVAVLLRALPQRAVWISLDGGSARQMYFSENFLEAVRDNRYRISFAPGFVTFVQEESAFVSGATPLNTLKGSAWVDSQGVVYLLNETDKTASLAYIPSDLRAYTVPETVGEEGKIYNLTSVSSNALARAYQLQEIKFDNPGEVTLKDFAFAGCSSLRTVNGEDTVEKASELFADVGKSVFLDTGLQGTASGTVISPEETIDASPDGNNAKFTITTDQVPEGFWRENWTTGTGNSVNITVHIEGMSVGQYWYRIYFLTSHSEFDLSGLQMEVGVPQEDKGIQFTLYRHPDFPGLYYVDIYAPDGATWSRPFTLKYPNLTPGGQVMVWAESGEGDVAAAPQTSPAGDYYRFTWETESAPITLSVSNNQNTYGYARLGIGQAITLSPDLSWKVELRTGPRPIYGGESVAQDPVRQAIHTMTFSLPEGFSWNSAITEKVQPLSLVNGYWCLGDTQILKTSCTDDHTYVQKGTAALVNGNLVLTIWQASKSQDLGVASLSLTLAQGTVVVDEGLNFDEPHNIVLDVNTQVLYAFDQPQTQSCSVNWTSESPEKDLKYSIIAPDVQSIAYNSEYYYRLVAANETIFNKPLNKISDPLPLELLITPAGIEKLFTLNSDELDNQNLAQYLTLTISNALRCTYNTNLGNVYLSDGLTQYQLTAEMTDENQISGEKVTVKITKGQEAGTLRVTFDSEDGEDVSIGNLQSYLQAKGFVVLSDTRFTVTWEFEEGHKVDSGDTYLVQIPVELKDTFQRLSTDWPIFRGAKKTDSPSDYTFASNTVSNTATFEDPDINKRSSSERYYRDYAIGKSVSSNSIQNGGILDYSIQVYQNEGSPREAGLPVVDVVSGTQCVLARVDQNAGRPWVANAEIHTAPNGTQYYLLKLPQGDSDGRYVYEGVWFNGYYADSVTVIARDKLSDEEVAKYDHSQDYTSMGSALATDGYVTEIRWYLTSNAYETRTLQYSILVDVAYSLVENASAGSVCNIAYLNDRDNQRLFFSTGTVPVITIDGNKEILDDSGQVLDGRTSTISAGETVHYRLTVNNWISEDVTIESQHLADILPSTFGVFEWTTENVQLHYALARSTDTENFRWEITKDESGGDKIIWPDGVQVPANGTLYIYVDLTFPADDTGDNSLWKQYCKAFPGNSLVNIFSLVNETYSVSHKLALPGSAYIQQGVYSSEYKYTGAAGNIIWINNLVNKDYHFYSQAPKTGESTMKELFYVVLYNDGPGPLYLTEIKSVFPTGAFALTGDVFSVAVAEPITKKNNFTSLPEEITLLNAKIKAKMSGEESFTFTFEPSNSGATISYDGLAKAYYLNPNEAIAFYYRCNILTDIDEIENTITMPLYDPYDTGVEVADISQIRNNYYMSGKVGNDGDCTYLTVEEGRYSGFDSPKADEGWLSSSVTLRKDTVPGLEKRVVNKRSTSGVVEPYPGYVGPMDSLQWELTVYNDGSNIIDGFTIEDLLPERYTLDEGKVQISGLWDGPSDPPSLYTLFEITKVETEDGKVTAVWLSDGNIVYVSGAVVRGDEYSLQLFYYGDQLAMNLSVFLQDDAGIIWPGENLKLTFWTKNYTNVNTSATYVNSAVLMIDEMEKVNDDKVIHGRVLQDESGRPMGILARGLALVSNGYATGSEKKVTEMGTNNTTSSTQNGTITLTQTGDGYSHFVYELQVDNNASGAKGMNWITLIDNLPKIGDTTTLNQSIPRGSQFQVEFAEDPNVKVWYTTQDGQSVDITDKAQIRYSDKVTFGDADWGTVDTNPTADDWSATSVGARSIRIYIPSVGGALAVPAGASLHVSFECQVGADAEPGGTAWNSFGYRYQMSDDNTTLEAAPLEVGVRLPNAPQILKVLTNKIGEPVAAERNTEFYFLVYEGEKISEDFATAEDFLNTLKSQGKDFTIVKVTVPEGESQAELKLKNLKVCTYAPASENGWKETETPWIWTNGVSYTVVELGDKLTVGLGSYQNYEFASMAYTPDNSYTFQYSVATSEEIRVENMSVSRQIQIQKVDKMNQSCKLPNAVFGLYSTNLSDQLTGDKLRQAAEEINLTAEQILELQEKLTFTHNGTNYYLYRLGKTDNKGLITWENLPGMSYCYVELWAPEGYYITEKDPIEVSFQVEGGYLRSITHTVTNNEIVYLPKTGGMGRWQIPALGLLLCTAVVTVFLGKRRKKAA